MNKGGNSLATWFLKGLTTATTICSVTPGSTLHLFPPEERALSRKSSEEMISLSLEWAPCLHTHSRSLLLASIFFSIPSFQPANVSLGSSASILWLPVTVTALSWFILTGTSQVKKSISTGGHATHPREHRAQFPWEFLG